MTENKADQEAVVPSEGQPQQPEQPPQAEPIKTRAAKLLETAEKLRAAESARRQTEELSHVIWHMKRKPPRLGPICTFWPQTGIELDQLLAGLTSNPDAVTCPECLAVLAEQQPEKSTPVLRDLPGLPPESKGEGDNHQPEMSPETIEPMLAAANSMASLLDKIAEHEHAEREKAAKHCEQQAAKSIELFETQNGILSDIKTCFDDLIKIGTEFLALDKTLGEELRKVEAQPNESP